MSKHIVPDGQQFEDDCYCQEGCVLMEAHDVCEVPAPLTSNQRSLVEELRGLLNAAWLLGLFRDCVPGTVGGQLREEVDATLKRTADVVTATPDGDDDGR